MILTTLIGGGAISAGIYLLKNKTEQTDTTSVSDEAEAKQDVAKPEAPVSSNDSDTATKNLESDVYFGAKDKPYDPFYDYGNDPVFSTRNLIQKQTWDSAVPHLVLRTRIVAPFFAMHNVPANPYRCWIYDPNKLNCIYPEFVPRLYGNNTRTETYSYGKFHFLIEIFNPSDTPIPIHGLKFNYFKIGEKIYWLCDNQVTSGNQTIEKEYLLGKNLFYRHHGDVITALRKLNFSMRKYPYYRLSNCDITNTSAIGYQNYTTQYDLYDYQGFNDARHSNWDSYYGGFLCTTNDVVKYECQNRGSSLTAIAPFSSVYCVLTNTGNALVNLYNEQNVRTGANWQTVIDSKSRASSTVLEQTAVSMFNHSALVSPIGGLVSEDIAQQLVVDDYYHGGGHTNPYGLGFYAKRSIKGIENEGNVEISFSLYKTPEDAKYTYNGFEIGQNGVVQTMRLKAGKRENDSNSVATDSYVGDRRDVLMRINNTNENASTNKIQELVKEYL